MLSLVRRWNVWQFPREKHPEREEIRDDRIGKSMPRLFQNARNVMNPNYRIEFAPIAAIITARRLLK
jgi:hypothetical protein